MPSEGESYMTRKVRHPYQVLEASEMVVGQRYAFIRVRESNSSLVSHYAMGSVLGDSCAAALRLGYDLLSVEKLQVEMFVAQATKSHRHHPHGWMVVRRRSQ